MEDEYAGVGIISKLANRGVGRTIAILTVVAMLVPIAWWFVGFLMR